MSITVKSAGVLSLFAPFFVQAQNHSTLPDSVAVLATIHVDLKKETGDMSPVWAWFGYDEPNYTYMKDGKKLLSEIAALSPVPVYVRAHSLLVTGDGEPALKWGSTNAYTDIPRMQTANPFTTGGSSTAFLILLTGAEPRRSIASCSITRPTL